MSIIDTIKSVIGVEDRTQETVGVIVDGPMLMRDDQNPESRGTWVFRLDSHPDVEFHQEDRPLAPERKRGDRVRVQYRHAEADTAAVEWMQKV